MYKYANELKEVYVILNTLDEEELKKIPEITMQAIKENMNEEYEYEIDEDIELENNEMLPKTRVVLFNIFRDYLASNEQREKIMRWQAKDRIRKRKLRESNYASIENGRIIERKDNTKIEQEKEIGKVSNVQKIEEKSLLEYKENIFTKFINKIKKLFNK